MGDASEEGDERGSVVRERGARKDTRGQNDFAAQRNNGPKDTGRSGSKWREARDGIPDEPVGMGSADDSGSVRETLGDRSVLQTAEADIEAVRLCGVFGQCDTVADLDGVIGAHVVEVPGVAIELAAHICAVICIGARSIMGKIPAKRFDRVLWDRKREL